jgi:hypothetical protein
MKYTYEIVKTGYSPTFNKLSRDSFTNPVSIGDHVKPERSGTELLLVESVEHYCTVSVLYVK